MTTTYYQELAAYNVWANELFIGQFIQTAQEIWEAPIVNSFPTIGDTVLHTAAAERVWIDRMNQKSNIVWLPNVMKATDKQNVLQIWREASLDLQALVEQFDNDKLQEGITITRINGDQFYMSNYQMLTHVFNHSTYHRGQMLTLLRQSGAYSVPSTDIMLYYRMINQKE